MSGLSWYFIAHFVLFAPVSGDKKSLPIPPRKQEEKKR